MCSKNGARAMVSVAALQHSTRVVVIILSHAIDCGESCNRLDPTLTKVGWGETLLRALCPGRKDKKINGSGFSIRGCDSAIIPIRLVNVVR